MGGSVSMMGGCPSCPHARTCSRWYRRSYASREVMSSLCFVLGLGGSKGQVRMAIFASCRDVGGVGGWGWGGGRWGEWGGKGRASTGLSFLTPTAGHASIRQ